MKIYSCNVIFLFAFVIDLKKKSNHFHFQWFLLLISNFRDLGNHNFYEKSVKILQVIVYPFSMLINPKKKLRKNSRKYSGHLDNDIVFQQFFKRVTVFSMFIGRQSKSHYKIPIFLFLAIWTSFIQCLLVIG